MQGEMSVKKAVKTVLGFAVGDALGLPYRGKTREELKEEPARDMTEDEADHLPAGAWSDLTGILLAEQAAMKNDIDFGRILTELKAREEEGKYTSTGNVVFRSEYIVSALNAFQEGTDPLLCGRSDDDSWNNESLCRMLPAVLHIFFDRDVDYIDTKECYSFVEKVSAITHRTPICYIACSIYTHLLLYLLEHKTQSVRELSAVAADKVIEYYNGIEETAEFTGYYKVMADEKFAETDENEIRSGSSVVNTLLAAVWCLVSSTSFEECLLKAVNLGGDTNAVAALAGSMAALVFPEDEAFIKWQNTLIKKEEITLQTENFYPDASTGNSVSSVI